MSDVLEQQSIHIWKSNHKKNIFECIRCNAKYKLSYSQRLCIKSIDLPKTGCILNSAYDIIGDITQYSDYDTLLLNEANRIPIN